MQDPEDVFFDCNTLTVCAVSSSRLAGVFYSNVLSGCRFEGLLIRNLPFLSSAIRTGMHPIHAQFNTRQLFKFSLDSMPPDAFQAELRASLISFYEGVFKVPGAGCPEARIIKRPPACRRCPPACRGFYGSLWGRGHLSGGDTAGPTSGCRGRSRAGGWQTESWQGSRGQGYQRMNKRVCACNDLKQLPLIVNAMQRFQKRTKIGRRPPPPPPGANPVNVPPCTAINRDRLKNVLS